MIKESWRENTSYQSQFSKLCKKSLEDLMLFSFPLSANSDSKEHLDKEIVVFSSKLSMSSGIYIIVTILCCI